MSDKEQIEALFGGDSPTPADGVKPASADAAVPANGETAAAKAEKPAQKPTATVAAKPKKTAATAKTAKAAQPAKPNGGEVVIRISDFTDEPEESADAEKNPANAEKKEVPAKPATPAASLPPKQGVTAAKPKLPDGNVVTSRPPLPSNHATAVAQNGRAQQPATPPPRNFPRTVDKHGQPIKKVVSMKKSILEKAHYTITEADEPTILEGLDAHLTFTTIAKQVGCCRGTLVKYIRNHPHLQEAATDSREEFDDAVEQQLFAKIQNGDLNAIFFYMQRRMRSRGYGDHQVVEQQGESKSIVIGHVAVPKEIPDYTKAIAAKMEAEGLADPAAMEIAAEAAAASAAQVERTEQSAAEQAAAATDAKATATGADAAQQAETKPLPPAAKKKSILEELEEAERNLPQYGSQSAAELAKAAEGAPTQPPTAPAPQQEGMPQSSTRRVPQNGDAAPAADGSFIDAGDGQGDGGYFDSVQPDGDFMGDGFGGGSEDAGGFFDAYGGGGGGFF